MTAVVGAGKAELLTGIEGGAAARSGRSCCWASRLPELPWTWCHPK
jgi:hypothetical protein